MKIVSKIHQKSIKNQWKWGTWGRPGATLGVFGLMLVESDEFGPHFGWIFFTFSLQDWSWMSFGVDLGAKLGPSWGQVRIKIEYKRCQKNNEKRLHLEGILKASWSHLGAKRWKSSDRPRSRHGQWGVWGASKPLRFWWNWWMNDEWILSGV